MGRKKKLLIADDNEHIHELLSQFLSVDEFDIIHAYNGEEALELAEDEQPDLIVLDIVMPLMDGREICRRLKNAPDIEDIKIILLTGRGEQYDRRVGLEVGADDYITKPCSITYLGNRIRKLLDKK